MFLKPCYNCPFRKDCGKKEAKLEILRGLGFTSARFRCDKRLTNLKPGQRVSLVLSVPHEPIEGGANTMEDESFTAIVMRPASGNRDRILVWVEDDPAPYGDVFEHRNPIPVRPDRVTPIDGERVNVCPECQQPEGTTARTIVQYGHTMWASYCSTCPAPEAANP